MLLEFVHFFPQELLILLFLEFLLGCFLKLWDSFKTFFLGSFRKVLRFFKEFFPGPMKKSLLEFSWRSFWNTISNVFWYFSRSSQNRTAEQINLKYSTKEFQGKYHEKVREKSLKEFSHKNFLQEYPLEIPETTHWANNLYEESHKNSLGSLWTNSWRKIFEER